MSKLVWDASGERFYETGVDHGVLYVKGASGYETGVAWNGLTGVSESPSGGEASAVFADNIKYLNLMSAEEFGGTIEAYTYPDEFLACDGSATLAEGVTIEGQKRATFGLCYRTKIGNDEDDDLGYKIHLVYGCKATPSEKSRQTVNDSPEAMQFSWTFTTTPIEVTAKDSNNKPFKPVAHLVLNSTKFNTTALKEKLDEIEEKLYGRDAVAADAQNNISAVEALTPTLLTPDQIFGIINENG